MFDWLLSKEARIQRNQRRLTNRDAQAEDREAAARWLVEEGSPKALVALLTRFEMNLTHQMNDKAEKEKVYGLLAGKGGQLRRPLEAHLRKCRQFAMPIRLLAEIDGAPAAVTCALDLLELERQRDDVNHPEKKANLLVWLTDHQDPRIIEVATRLLGDFDEGVRYAAAEAIAAQREGTEEVRRALEGVLARRDEDSNRLRARVASLFAQRRWPCGEDAGANLPPGYAWKDSRVVTA